MVEDCTINDFLTKLGAASATPGGGSASAITGAIGISLAKMVAGLTVGKEKYTDYEELNQDALKKLTDLNIELLKLANEDIDSYNLVMGAYCLPNTTEDELVQRACTIQSTLIQSTVVPFNIMKTCYAGLVVVESIFNKSNVNANSDLVVAALNLNTAIQGCYSSINTNLTTITNSAFVHEYSKNSSTLLNQSKKIIDKLSTN